MFKIPDNVSQFDNVYDVLKERGFIEQTTDDEGNVVETTIEAYHPSANAKMRAYVVGDGYEGLMSVDGHVVTMPLYKSIEAIGYDLYLCDVSNGDHVLVNGKGEIIK